MARVRFYYSFKKKEKKEEKASWNNQRQQAGAARLTISITLTAAPSPPPPSSHTRGVGVFRPVDMEICQTRRHEARFTQRTSVSLREKMLSLPGMAWPLLC